jgi:CRP/FNR family transcriptional regulator, cyclic AMP receptor protein
MSAHRKLKSSGGAEVESYLDELRGKKTRLAVPKRRFFFSQGKPAKYLFFIQSGHVKLFVLSKQRKEAVLGLLGPGDVFGEWCVSGHIRQLANATAVTDCVVTRVHKNEVLAAMQQNEAFANFLIGHLLRRNRAVEENLVDLMFNSTEKRLARALLQVARFGKSEAPLLTVPKVNQDTLAALIGSTRQQVNFLMNKFKKLGFIEYNGGMEVRNSLLNVLLRD